MMRRPKQPIKVSVLMSVYNGEKYLREAIDSILNQTFTDFEFIIINDGSTDKTKEILESYSDVRIRLFHQENMGLTKSLNRGLKDAIGEYIARQDADDTSYPERLEKQVKYLDENHETGLVGTQVVIIDDRGREIVTYNNLVENDKIQKELIRNNTFCHGSVIFRKECLNKVGYYREKFKYTQDYDFWLRIAEIFKVANIDNILYKLRKPLDSITRRKTSQQLNHHLLAIELAKERRRAGKDRLEMIEMDEIVSTLRNLYKINISIIRQFKSNYFMAYCRESLKLEYYLNSFYFWLKAFVLAPDISKIKFLLKALFIIMSETKLLKKTSFNIS